MIALDPPRWPATLLLLAGLTFGLHRLTVRSWGRRILVPLWLGSIALDLTLVAALSLPLWQRQRAIGP